MPSAWTSYPWTPEQQVALAGLGPPWRVAMQAKRLAPCPTCKAPTSTPCAGSMHVDRILACAAHLRATATDRRGRPLFPPPVLPDDPLAEYVRAKILTEGYPLAPAEQVHVDTALSAAAYCGRVRLGMDGGRWMWMLTRAGVEAWCTNAVVE